MTKSRFFQLILVSALVLLPFCDEGQQQMGGTDSWLIPNDKIMDGGPGKDGIVAISNPTFIPVPDANFLDDGDLVVGLRIGNVIRAFPHAILDHHEIVNYSIDNIQFSLSYCPLTGSALAWDTGFLTPDPTMGVSGLLYNSNLILYDRQTDGNWSQMLMQCVNGEFIGRGADLIPLVETTWGTWKGIFPSSEIMSTETGFHNDYRTYPYGNYKTNDTLIFPVDGSDDRLPTKERVLGVVVDGRAKVYPIRNFADPLEIINDVFQGSEFIVAGGAARDLALAFDRRLEDGTLLIFSSLPEALPIIMTDQDGGQWDVFGRSVSGSRKGTQLQALKSFNGYWFAWAAFYPGPDIHGQPSLLHSRSKHDTGWQLKSSRHPEYGVERRAISRKRLRDRLLAERKQLGRSVRVPVIYGVVPVSFGLELLTQDGILSELGLEEGDLILSVNDIPLHGGIRVTEVVGRLVSASHLRLDLLRRGQPMTLHILLN